ncbi:hypothetical protein E3N88_34545 [Mikania micrantha]|uniref:Uncharacterized protein n=1 Tax=Mikania micrantha TaxID=192012 RepID=A0A5N6LYF8_9ASTR|nr:hypothetical protein E3N88_34545 [Mikania micrantha]
MQAMGSHGGIEVNRVHCDLITKPSRYAKTPLRDAPRIDSEVPSIDLIVKITPTNTGMDALAFTRDNTTPYSSNKATTAKSKLHNENSQN